MALLRCLNSPFFALPRHDRCRLRKSAPLEDLVPPDQAAPMSAQIVGELVHEIGLQRILSLDAPLLHESLHPGRTFPLILDRLVTAEVNVRTGEDRHNLVKDVLDELDAFVAWIE